MGYSQNPLNVLKGQMKNKAVGLAHGDSMAMQVDVKSGEPSKEYKARLAQYDELRKEAKSIQGPRPTI